MILFVLGNFLIVGGLTYAVHIRYTTMLLLGLVHVYDFNRLWWGEHPQCNSLCMLFGGKVFSSFLYIRIRWTHSIAQALTSTFQCCIVQYILPVHVSESCTKCFVGLLFVSMCSPDSSTLTIYKPSVTQISVKIMTSYGMLISTWSMLLKQFFPIMSLFVPMLPLLQAVFDIGLNWFSFCHCLIPTQKL